MTDPGSLGEFNALYMERLAITGEGIEGVTQHFPCPFCAAPDWLVVKIIDFAASDHAAPCEACGREARLEVTSGKDGTSMELVQVAGDDPPAWMNPTPRRVQR